MPFFTGLELYFTLISTHIELCLRIANLDTCIQEKGWLVFIKMTVHEKGKIGKLLYYIK